MIAEEIMIGSVARLCYQISNASDVKLCLDYNGGGNVFSILAKGDLKPVEDLMEVVGDDAKYQLLVAPAYADQKQLTDAMTKLSEMLTRLGVDVNV